MNKIIFTNDRVFMVIVGPSGSGKTKLIFSMLEGETFHPRFENIFFLLSGNATFLHGNEKEVEH